MGRERTREIHDTAVQLLLKRRGPMRFREILSETMKLDRDNQIKSPKGLSETLQRLLRTHSIEKALAQVQTPKGQKQVVVYKLTEKGEKLIEGAYQLIWNLYEFQEKMAWYAHADITGYWEYGLQMDVARFPNTGLRLIPNADAHALEILEHAFMLGLQEAIDTKSIALEPKDGKFLVAFEIDWAKFIEKYEANSNRILPYKPTKKQKEISRKVSDLAEDLRKKVIRTGKLQRGPTSDAETGEIVKPKRR